MASGLEMKMGMRTGTKGEKAVRKGDNPVGIERKRSRWRRRSSEDRNDQKEKNAQEKKVEIKSHPSMAATNISPGNCKNR